MEPNAREAESQRVAQHLLYILPALERQVPPGVGAAASSIYGDRDSLDEWTALLCSTCKEVESDPPSAEAYLYNGRKAQARRLADWWDQHKAADARREEAEAEADERARTEPLLAILKANGHDPETMVSTDTGERTALQVLESQVGHALDLIEGTEEAQIPE
tara:strand:+ start:165439 stop:165924 length:486 start_codon:yes stop_codon:yes gene_type:complete